MHKLILVYEKKNFFSMFYLLEKFIFLVCLSIRKIRIIIIIIIYSN